MENLITPEISLVLKSFADKSYETHRNQPQVACEGDPDFDPWEDEREGVADFIVVGTHPDGSLEVKDCLNAACHYDLHRYGYTHWDDAIQPNAVLDCLHRYKWMVRKKHKKGYRQFVKWMTQRSPWADNWLNASNQKKMFREGCMLNLEKRGNDLIFAVTALRQGVEYSNFYNPSWKRMVDLGIEEFHAWAMAFFLRYDDVKGKWYHQDFCSSHSPIYGGMERDEFFKFMRRGGALKTIYHDKSYLEDANYNNFFRDVARSDHNYNEKTELRGWFKEQKVGKKKGKGFDVETVLSDADILIIADNFNKEIQNA